VTGDFCFLGIIAQRGDESTRPTHEKFPSYFPTKQTPSSGQPKDSDLPNLLHSKQLRDYFTLFRVFPQDKRME
jgi:hypothetical protein